MIRRGDENTRHYRHISAVIPRFLASFVKKSPLASPVQSKEDRASIGYAGFEFHQVSIELKGSGSETAVFAGRGYISSVWNLRRRGKRACYAKRDMYLFVILFAVLET
jgi:hypothetical protein